MTRIEWDQDNQRLYETGTDRVVLYVKGSDGYGEGTGWNGFTGLTESPSGAEETALYANNGKYLSLYSKEEFGGTLKAYTDPEAWEECDGSAPLKAGEKGIMVAQQTRKTFGLTYRTMVGNQEEGDEHDYKIHLVYGATASPSGKDYQTINNSPEAIEFSWDFKTVPIKVDGHKETSVITIQKSKVTDTQLGQIERALYGTASSAPTLLMPDDLVAILNGTYSGNGATATTGSDNTTGSGSTTGV